MWRIINDFSDPDAISYLFNWMDAVEPAEADYRHIMEVFPPDIIGAREFSFIPYGGGTGLLGFFHPNVGAYQISNRGSEAIKTLNLFTAMGLEVTLEVKTGDPVMVIGEPDEINRENDVAD